MTKEHIKKVIQNNIFIIFIFAILAVLSGSLLFHYNVVGNNFDTYFHFARIYEIKDEFINGNFLSAVALNKFYQNGSAVMTMYPKINLLPIVLLTFFIKSFAHLVYITYILRNFLSLLIAYFSCYTFNRNKKVSFLFSIIYTLSMFTIWSSFIVMDIGITSSLIFLPMILFGCLQFIENKKWKELSIGMSLIMCSHIINSMLAVIFTLVLLILNYKKINNKVHLQSILKAFITTAMITCIFWLPFVMLNINNKISLPIYVGGPLQGIGLKTFIIEVIHINEIVTIVACIGIILSVVNYNKMSLLSKQLFWISLVILLIISPLFPWNALNGTFVETILQRSTRLFIIPQLLLCYLFAENYIKLVNRKKNGFIFFMIAIVIMIFGQILSQVRIIRTYNSKSVSFSDRIHIVYKNQPFFTDYFPQNAISQKSNILNHYALYGKNKKSIVKLLGNGRFTFNLDQTTKSLTMPFFIYKNIDYQVKIDNRNVKFNANNHSQLTLDNVNKGKHTVQVIVHKSWYDYVSYVLSALGIVVLAFAWIKTLIWKRKNK